MLTLDWAEPDDAETIARIVRETSAGVADYLLGRLSAVLPAERLLTSVIMEPDNPLSHENVLLARNGETVAGLLLGYPAADHGIPAILRRTVAARKLTALHGMLEVTVPDTYYINTLWVEAASRGTGLAGDLLECAGLTAAAAGLSGLCLHVWLENVRAVRFYVRHGFATVARFPAPPHRGFTFAGGYALMTCPVRPDTED